MSVSISITSELPSSNYHSLQACRHFISDSKQQASGYSTYKVGRKVPPVR